MSHWRFNQNVKVFDGRTRSEIAGGSHLVGLSHDVMILRKGCWQFGRIKIATFYQWVHASILGPDSMGLFRCKSEHDLNQRASTLDPNSPDILEIGTYVLLNEGEN